MEVLASGEQTSRHLSFGPAEFSDNILNQFGHDSDRGIPSESRAPQVFSCQLCLVASALAKSFPAKE